MRLSWTTGFSCVLLVAIATGVSVADQAADVCGGSKEKAAGRYGQGIMACHSVATRRGETVSSECTGKSVVKLNKGFAHAEGVGGCATNGDAASTRTSLDNYASSVLAIIPEGSGDDAHRCAAAKMKAAGKHLRALLTCYAVGAKQSAGPQSDCFEKADTKLHDGFVRAESKGGCASSGNASNVDAVDTSAARQQVAALSPVCGDGITGPTQQCEIGDDTSCVGLCTVACACQAPPDCGNGIAEYPEECDDGAHDSGDGCSPICQLENASALCAGVATTAGTSLNAVLVSDQFSQPIFVTAAPLDPNRLFVLEREGRIRIVYLATGAIDPDPFLDITDRVGATGEGGLLGMAFDPDYDTNGRFFLNYTNADLDTQIVRFERSVGDPSTADVSSAKTLLQIIQPFDNHKGGMIAFGSDGYLYVGMGDGGSGDDPLENGQNDSTLLAKMLRIDVDVDVPPYWAVPADNPHYVDGTSELELIWAKGLRNPFRYSFDRGTGDLLIADVGQGAIEEVDFRSAASTGGENYGWDVFEGTTCHEPDPAPMCPAPPTGFTMPIYEYGHTGVCTSITGGYVYRGCAIPDLDGTYFFSDFCHNFIDTFEISGGAAVNFQDRTTDVTSAGATFAGIASFGEDARGELYIVDIGGGSVYRIEAE